MSQAVALAARSGRSLWPLALAARSGRSLWPLALAARSGRSLWPLALAALAPVPCGPGNPFPRTLRRPTVPLAVLLGALLLGMIPAARAAIVPKHTKSFRKFENCRFVPAPYNDGDSFRVAIQDDEFVFRLYYVDTPESDSRFPLRNAEQARAFAITPDQSIELGRTAKKFVADFLSAKPFTVHTRWASALGSSGKSRYYAVIERDGQDLAEVLIQNGLARLHGTLVNHPSGLSGIDFVSRLRAVEEKARAAKQGAWALSDPQNLPPEPEILEVPEPEIIRETSWPERFVSAGLGGAFIGALWLLTAFTRRKPTA